MEEVSVLIERLSARIGNLVAENEWLSVQLEAAKKRIEELEKKVGTESDTKPEAAVN